MEWEFRYDADQGFLEVVVRGELTTAGMNAMAAERYLELARHGTRKFLFDFRQSRNSLSVLDIYQRPDEAERAGSTKRNHSAAVVPAADYESFQFMETVYRNRGYDLKVFTSREEAVLYLAGYVP